MSLSPTEKIEALPEQRPIAIRVGALGDMVMFLPVVTALAKCYGGAKVDVVTTGGASEKILRHHPSIGEIFVLPGTKGRPLWLSPSKKHLRRWLAQRHDSSVYLFERNEKLLDVVKASGIPEHKTKRLSTFPCDLSRHQIDDLIDFVDPLFPQTLSSRAPSLDRQKLPAKETIDWLTDQNIDPTKPLILLQPGNRRTARGGRLNRSSNVKFWSLENWVAVIQYIGRRQAEANIILCGAPGEYKMNQKIIALCKQSKVQNIKNLHNVADTLPLERLMSLCTMAESMISVDTGPAHFAGALNCPLVVLFGPTSPHRYTPRSLAPVMVVTEAGLTETDTALAGSHQAWQDSYQMHNIAPETVALAWQKLADNNQKSHHKRKCA